MLLQIINGVDIGNTPVGTEVTATEAGIVSKIGFNDRYKGNYVYIDHGNGYVSQYKHNSQILVKQGDTVAKGDKIALSGNTGASSGPHLHFQIECNGNPVDPLSFKYDNGMGNGTNGVGSNVEVATETSHVSSFYIKVPTWSESSSSISSNDSSTDNSSSSSYNMSSTNIEYQKFISGYTMPFEYLWSFLVIGGDKDFVFELSDLVRDSDIEITIHDNVTIDTNVITNSYTRKKKTLTDATVTVNYGTDATNYSTATPSNSWEDVEDSKHEITQTVVNKTNTLNVALTKADVWIVNYEQKFTRGATETSSTETTKDLPDMDYSDTPEISNEDTYGHGADLLKEQDTYYKKSYSYVESSLKSIIEKKFYGTFERKEKTTNTLEITEYESAPATTDEKTDIDAQEPNFVNILARDECRKAKLNILQARNWLFEILEKNEATADMVDLTKYLLSKVTGKSYGVDEYDFGTYDPANFEPIGGSSVSGSNNYELFKQFIHQMEWGTKSEDGKYYIVESNGKAVGDGIDIPTFGAQLRSKGYSTTPGSKIPVEVVDAIEDDVIQTHLKTVRSLGLNLTEYQEYALVSRMYNFGSLATKTQFLNAYKNYWKETDDKYGKKDEVDYNHKLYTQYMHREKLTDRRKAEFLLFQTGWFVWEKTNFSALCEKNSGVDNITTSGGGNQAIVAEAKKHLGKPYILGANGPNSFDCAGFTTYVYKTAIRKNYSKTRNSNETI